tara:strand:- start:751 stop:1263 length:513 start_codon:yes stop_codon:yes gene_type:complete
MKLSHLTCLILLTLFSCSEKVDDRVINNMDRYEEAKNYLINNLNQIDNSRNYTRHDSSMRSTYKTIFASNRYYFENTLIPEYPGLKNLLTLWDNKLIENDKVVHALILKKDSIVKFTIKSNIGIFSGTDHLLVYDQNSDKYQVMKNAELLFEKDIKANWKYVIVKEHYVD